MKIETLEKMLDMGFTKDEIMKIVNSSDDKKNNIEGDIVGGSSEGGEGGEPTTPPDEGNTETKPEPNTNNDELLKAIKDLNKSIQSINRNSGEVVTPPSEENDAKAIISNFLKGAN